MPWWGDVLVGFGAFWSVIIAFAILYAIRQLGDDE